MPIQTPCPGCKTTLALPENAQGKTIRCPKCNQVFVMPSAAAPVAAAPPPPAPVVDMEIGTSVQEGTKISVPPVVEEAKPEAPARTGSMPPPVSKSGTNPDDRDAPSRSKSRRPPSSAGVPIAGILVLAAGVLAVLGMCVVCSGAGWFFWAAAPRAMNQPLAQQEEPVAQRKKNDAFEKKKVPTDFPREDFKDDTKEKVVEVQPPVEEKKEPIFEPKADPPPVEKGEKLTRRASLTAVMAEIKPPVLEADRVERPLPETLRDVVVGRAGRYLLLRFDRQVAVFDVNEAKIAKFIPLAGPNVKIAAGRDHMITVNPDDRKIERWSLLTFQKEATADLPSTGKITSIAMGAGSRGPLYLGTNDGFKATPLIDIDMLKPLELLPKFRNLPRDPHYLRASLDGATFCMRPGVGGEPHTVGVVTLNGCTVAKKEAWGVNSSVVSPGPNGKFLYSGYAVFSPDVQILHPIPAPQSSAKPFVAGVHGPYFMKFDFKDWDQLGGSIDFFLEGKYDSFARLTGLDGVSNEQVAYGTNRDTLTHDKRVTFIPRANLLVCIPKANNKLVLVRFDPQEALKKSGKDFLIVITEPEIEANKANPYRYQIDALSSNGKAICELQAGPGGMKVSKDGLVQWEVPRLFPDAQVQVIVTVTSGARQIFHSFMIDVAD